MRRGLALGLAAVAACLLVARAQGSTASAAARNGLIAFDDGKQIYTMTASGAHARVLTTASRASVEPSFSPDGRQIVFVRNAANRDHELWTMNANGSHQTRLTWTKRIGEEDPVWSPDGTQIAFNGGRGPSRGIWVMNRDGSGRRLVVQGGGEPRWSPDASLIAFVSATGPFSVIPAAGGQTTVLDPGHVDDDGNFNWTPDGRIVFSRWVRVGPQVKRGIQTDLFVMDADGSNVHRITTTPGFDEDQPVWAPGGTKILFAAQNNGMGRYLGGPGIALYTMNPDGTNRRELTHGKSSESNYFDPSWQSLR